MDERDRAMTCPVCGAGNSATSNYCENCGSALTSGSRRSHTVGFKTDIGNSHHVNQDAGGAWTWTRSDGVPVSLLIVADGVSAGRHSEGASMLAVETIRDRLLPLVRDSSVGIDELLGALLDSAREANSQIARRPHTSVSTADATTLVAAVCVGDDGAGVWCGDSRVYHIGLQGMTLLTRDHSWAEGVVSHGIMSAESAAQDPRARMITRWLGPPEQEDPGLESFRFGLATGEVVMCCTDGLYLYFSPPPYQEDEMARIVQTHRTDLQGALDRLVSLALERGGRDNITAAAIRADSAVVDGAFQPAETVTSGDIRVEETVRLNRQPL